MDKILSIDTIKNVFAALGAKTTDSNYAVGLFDKTSAEPKGIMGMSDLATVLGVGSYGKFGIAQGDYQDIAISYGLLLVSDAYGVSTCLYSIRYGNVDLIYPTAQGPSYFTIERQSNNTVRITATISAGGSGYLYVKVLRVV